MAVNSFNAQNPPVNTKGDLFTFSTIPTKLGVGSNNQVLTADSTTATGLKWATASSGGMTQIATASPSGVTNVEFTSIPGTYKHLLVTWASVYGTVDDVSFDIQVNSDTDVNYVRRYAGMADGSASSGGTGLTDKFQILRTSGSSTGAANKGNGHLIIYNYTDTSTYRTLESISSMRSNGNLNNIMTCSGYWINTANAITSVKITASSGNLSAGKFILYGVA